MSEADENDPERADPRPKKPYTTPRLIEYGRATDLTGSGTGTKPEPNPGGGSPNKHT